MTGVGHAWLPRTSCTEACVSSGLGQSGHHLLTALRAVRRIVSTVLVLLMLPVLAVPLPGHVGVKRLYCRLILGCLGVRITLSGGPIRNLRGMLVVANHVSWVDVFAIGAVLPGSFVARADLIDWPAVGLAARLVRVIPIERHNLRQLPRVVDTMAQRLRADCTVVAFPEGTTYCGHDSCDRDRGRFRPAMFQAAIDSGRPVQPLRLTYHHRDGSRSTVPAFLGDDSLWASIYRIVRTRQTVVHLQVRPLQLPQTVRGQLAQRCQESVFLERAGHCPPAVPAATLRVVEQPAHFPAYSHGGAA